MSLDKLIESRIQDAMAAGAFSRLSGEGRPLPLLEGDLVAGESWAGYKLLNNAGMLPPWLLLAREIEVDLEQLDRIEARFREWVDLAATTGWQHHAAAIRRLREQFAERAAAVRRKQDQFNFDAPSLALERPGIWIDYRLGRLDACLRNAGPPPRLFEWIEDDQGQEGPAPSGS